MPSNLNPTREQYVNELEAFSRALSNASPQPSRTTITWAVPPHETRQEVMREAPDPVEFRPLRPRRTASSDCRPSSRLRMTADANEGAFVRTLQGETGTGFQEGTHVHKDWYAKTIDYDAALELINKASREREDLLVEVGAIGAKVNDEGKFCLTVEDRELVPTDHALQQMSIRINLQSSSVLRELRNVDGSDSIDADVMVRFVKNGLRRIDNDKKFRIRSYTDGTCRAFVSERYAPVDNEWYLETLRSVLPEARLSHWKGDEDTIYGNILLPDSILQYDEDSEYGAMISVSNCEIGKRVISQRPSLFRSICMNGCIWGQVEGQKIRRRHVGAIDLQALKEIIAENITEQIPLIPEAIERFLRLKDYQTEVRTVPKLIASACNFGKLKKSEASLVLQQYDFEPMPNMFGVVNAITRAGQLLSPDRWVAFDELAGSIANGRSNVLYSMLGNSERMSDADMLSTFGMSC